MAVVVGKQYFRERWQPTKTYVLSQDEMFKNKDRKLAGEVVLKTNVLFTHTRIKTGPWRFFNRMFEDSKINETLVQYFTPEKKTELPKLWNGIGESSLEMWAIQGPSNLGKFVIILQHNLLRS